VAGEGLHGPRHHLERGGRHLGPPVDQQGHQLQRLPVAWAGTAQQLSQAKHAAALVVTKTCVARTPGCGTGRGPAQATPAPPSTHPAAHGPAHVPLQGHHQHRGRSRQRAVRVPRRHGRIEASRCPLQHRRQSPRVRPRHPQASHPGPRAGAERVGHHSAQRGVGGAGERRLPCWSPRRRVRRARPLAATGCRRDHHSTSSHEGERGRRLRASLAAGVVQVTSPTWSVCEGWLNPNVT
jgi:hypothetical protein